MLDNLFSQGRHEDTVLITYRGPQGSGTSLVAQTVKNPPAMQDTWVRSLGWEDPLEKGMATHSSILAWSPAFNLSQHQGLFK